MIKKIFYLKFIFLFTILMISKTANAQAEKAALDGSFITGDLCYSWSDARWQKEFTAMKNAGMHYIVIASVASSYPGKVTTTIYPSSLPNTKMAKAGDGKKYPDIVDACLRNAQKAGIKVFVGIDMSDRWWVSPADDTTWFYGQMRFDNEICDELWSNYKSKYPDAFYGWYWGYEADNFTFTKPEQQQVLINAMNIQLDHLKTKNEKLPFMWCPFMNSNLGTPEAYRKMWENVFAGLHTTNGDIFCPQDCVGAGGLKLNEVATWFSELRKAVNTKPGLLFWSDVETFEFYGLSFKSATIGRLVSQLKIEQPYVDNYISWEYTYYDSPNHVDSGFQETYLGYLKTGSLETISPTTPPNFTVKLKENGDVVLNWGKSEDNIGVCGYYVYRNGILISNKQEPIIKGSNNNYSLTSLIDVGLEPNTSYTYKVMAYDFANNVSRPTKAIEINEGAITILPNNVALGCSYTVSIPAYTLDKNKKNTKLTDGIYANVQSVKDTNWEGFHDTHQKPRDVIIDLGKITPVQQFTASFLHEPSALVYLPVEVEVLISTDNIDFKKVGKFPNPNIPHTYKAAAYKYRYTLPKPVLARYVNFRTKPRARWFDQLTFDDEFEVRNNITTDTKK